MLSVPNYLISDWSLLLRYCLTFILYVAYILCSSFTLSKLGCATADGDLVELLRRMPFMPQPAYLILPHFGSALGITAQKLRIWWNARNGT